MIEKVINRVEHAIDFRSTHGKILATVVMGVLGAFLGGLFALALATIGSSGISSETMFIVAAGLLFLIFINKMFL